MKIRNINHTLAVTLGMLALALLLVPNATAQCGGIRQPAATHTGWHYQLGQPRLQQAAFVTSSDFEIGGEAAIVGFWHVKFISQGSAGIPDGTEVDAGYAQWHSDGTEIMNSGGRSPITGAFCLGVWQKTGLRSYKLNHFAAAWDSTGSNLVGPANIKEQITLASNGNQFSGTFTIDQYTEAGNSVAHVQGNITGVRITVDTPPTSVF
jgi:hypothetical protein